MVQNKKSNVQRQIYRFKKCSVSVCVWDKMRHSVQIRIPPLPDKAVYSLSIETYKHTSDNESAQRTASRCYKFVVANIVRKYFVWGRFLNRGKLYIKKKIIISIAGQCELLLPSGGHTRSVEIWTFGVEYLKSGCVSTKLKTWF